MKVKKLRKSNEQNGLVKSLAETDKGNEAGSLYWMQSKLGSLQQSTISRN